MQDVPLPPLRSALHEGAFWLVAGSGLQKILGLASGIVLARLLVPSDFGAFAMAAFAFELANLFSGLGAAQYIVAARDGGARLSAVHRLNLAVSLILTALLAGLAPAAARFFGEPRLAGLIWVLSPALSLGALGAVHGALLERNLRLGAVARRRAAVNAGATLLTIGLAFGGLGVWALVIPFPLKAAAGSWLNRRLCSWRHVPADGMEGWREIVDYGRHILGTKISGFLAHQIDNAAVGRVLGATALGVYDFAYRIAMMPLRWGGDLATRLSFPAMASVARGPAPGGSSTILDASRWTVFLAAPVAAGLVIVAPDWVRVLYGPRWTEAVPLIRVLAPAGFILLLASPVVSWLQANRREAWPARIQFGVIPIMGVVLFLTVPRGIHAVAAGMGAILVLQSAALAVAALKAGAAPPAPWVGAVWSGCRPALIMVVILAPAARAMGFDDAPAIRLAVLVPLGVVVFSGASAILARSELRELAVLVRRGGGSRGRAAPGDPA